MIKKPEQSSTGNKVEDGPATISISTSSLPTLPSSTDTASKTAVKDNDKNQSNRNRFNNGINRYNLFHCCRLNTSFNNHWNMHQAEIL